MISSSTSSSFICKRLNRINSEIWNAAYLFCNWFLQINLLLNILCISQQHQQPTLAWCIHVEHNIGLSFCLAFRLDLLDHQRETIFILDRKPWATGQPEPVPLKGGNKEI